MEDNQTSPATSFDIRTLADEAWDAVGQILARRFPEARCGDLSPERTLVLRSALEDAIAEWIDNNVPPRSHGDTA